MSRRLGAGAAAGLLTGAALVLAATPARAQTVRVVGTHPLDFGTVAPLGNRVVAPAAGGAARFTVQGPPHAALTVTLALPTVLVRGGAAVPVTAWAGTVTPGGGGTAAAFVPVSGGEFALTLDATGTATVALGATLRPPMTAGGGAFAGVLTLVAREPSTGRQSLTAQAAATATLLQPLVLTVTPMQFPRVFAGTPATTAPDGPAGMRVAVDGALAAQVDVTLDALPAALARVGGGGSLPIGGWVQRAGGACTGAPAAAAAGVPTTLALSEAVGGSTGRASYCLGATVTPAAVQPAGSYTGTVVVSVRYTGA